MPSTHPSQQHGRGGTAAAGGKHATKQAKRDYPAAPPHPGNLSTTTSPSRPSAEPSGTTTQTSTINHNSPA
ncbi:hypothetical protein E2C01_002988 [Portunus trituberculatus]|uniref:Uncharacterized protein n=1 Tax=Portunus trituberculatus TaxID=210409 RepID=A0A5B7CNZ0_PORTR|nr:hypothetical protein [Portunus trituberculatus]